MTGKLIIFSAPSGSGKTSIVAHLLRSDIGLRFSISATSRKPRKVEKDGTDYYFISAKEFRKKIDNREFIEWEEVYEDHFYGTLRSEIERIWLEGHHVIFDVDVIGGINLKKLYGSRALSVFVQPPSVDELRKRLLLRGADSKGKIEMRITKAEEELNQSVKFDQVIINDNLEKACREAEKIVGEFIRT